MVVGERKEGKEEDGIALTLPALLFTSTSTT